MVKQPKGVKYPVLTVRGCIIPGFVVRGCILDKHKSSRVYNGLFQKKKTLLIFGSVAYGGFTWALPNITSSGFLLQFFSRLLLVAIFF